MGSRYEQPHFRALCKDGSSWSLPLNEFKAFEAAWTTSKTFWWGIDLMGSPVIVKLFDVTGVVVLTEDALRRHVEEAEMERAKAMLDGDQA